MSKKEQAFIILDRAASTLDTAEYDLLGGHILATVNRAYYGIYYCIFALLYTENIIPKSHKGALIKFSELFIKTGKMPEITSVNARTAFNLRQEADYDFDIDISDVEAKILINNAKHFYKLTKAYLEKVEE